MLTGGTRLFVTGLLMVFALTVPTALLKSRSVPEKNDPAAAGDPADTKTGG
jgi:hypothetical protein